MALAESCISRQVARETPALTGAQIDLTAALPQADTVPQTPEPLKSVTRLDALLFGETQGRVIVTTSAHDAVKVIERAKLLGITAMRIGTVGGDKLEIKTHAGQFSWAVTELHDLWWNLIARAMKD